MPKHDAALEDVLDQAMEEIKHKPCEHLGCARTGCWLCVTQTVKWAMTEYLRRKTKPKSADSSKEAT